MLFAFDGLAVGLETVAHRLEQFANLGAADDEPLLLEFSCQNSGTLDRPSQGRHRIASCARSYQLFECLTELRLFAFARVPSRTGPTLPTGIERLRTAQLLDPILNRGASKACCRGNDGDSSTSDGHGLSSRPATRATFVKIHQDRSKLPVNRIDQFGIWHDRTYRRIQCYVSMSF